MKYSWDIKLFISFKEQLIWFQFVSSLLLFLKAFLKLTCFIYHSSRRVCMRNSSNTNWFYNEYFTTNAATSTNAKEVTNSKYIIWVLILLNLLHSIKHAVDVIVYPVMEKV